MKKLSKGEMKMIKGGSFLYSCKNASDCPNNCNPLKDPPPKAGYACSSGRCVSAPCMQ